jgi:hypothetical protein
MGRWGDGQMGRWVERVMANGDRLVGLGVKERMERMERMEGRDGGDGGMGTGIGIGVGRVRVRGSESERRRGQKGRV